MSALQCDAAASRALLDRDLARALAREPWRTVAARAAAADPARYAHVAAPGAAAVLVLLPLERVAEALVVADPWGTLAVPLARRCRVTALCDAPAQAAMLRAVAAAEAVPIAVAVGSPAVPPQRPAALDCVIVPDLARLPAAPGAPPEAALAALAALLRPGGVLYAAGVNALAAGHTPDSAGATLAEYRALFAAVGLGAPRVWACWPHVAAPRQLAPLGAVAAVLDLTATDTGTARLARSGIAEHLVPGYAFLCPAAAGPREADRA